MSKSCKKKARKVKKYAFIFKDNIKKQIKQY